MQEFSSFTGSYPSTKPNIIIRSSILAEEDIEKLTEEMEDLSDASVGSHMIQKLLDKANLWINRRKINWDAKVKPKNSSKEKAINQVSLRKQQRKSKKEKIEKEETVDEKKPSMKTADDVVKRILWDGNLPTDEFLVGYIDRFLGIQEKYFTSFSWEDIASVDYNVLAVPKHRIQYFKYRDITVWDKNRRLDNVFGSAGSKLTIYDVIEQYNNKKAENDGDDGTVENNTYFNDDKDDDSSDDDGITVSIGNVCGVQDEEEEKECVDDQEDEYDKYWRDKMRPNHFLALRITSDEVKNVIEGIQDSIIEHEPTYEQCCIPLNALHLTLCTVGLDTHEQVAHACQVLKKIQGELKDMINKDSKIVFKGMQNFFNRVLYAKCECPQEFFDMVAHLRLCLKEEGIDIRDNHEFVPHMTIMKITRTVARATGKKYIAPWLYSNSQDIDFGSQIVDNIFLCEMGISRQGDGFYISPQKIDLQ